MPKAIYYVLVQSVQDFSLRQSPKYNEADLVMQFWPLFLLHMVTYILIGCFKLLGSDPKHGWTVEEQGAACRRDVVELLYTKDTNQHV